MKKIIALVLAVVMIMSFGLLTGCSDNNNTGSGANFDVPEGGYDGSEVTITFYHTMGSALRDELDKAIARFNELYPNITIEHEQVGGYTDVQTQISTKLTANDQPNLAYCYPDHVARYNITGKVISLDNLINSTIEQQYYGEDGGSEILGLTEEQIADFYEVFWEEGSSYGDGLTYSVPLARSVEVLYYNKTYFEENNLSVPTTWEEMEEVCEQIMAIETKYGREKYCVPLGYDSESNWFITYCEQAGLGYTSLEGDHYIFDGDANKEFVKWVREMYQNGYVTTQTLSGAYTSSLFTETKEGELHCYMCIGSTGGASYQTPDNGEFEVGVALIPQYDTSNPKVISQGPSLCIFESDNEQEVVATWLFAKFLMTDQEFQASFSMTSGYMPVIKSANDLEGYQNWLAKADGYNYLVPTVVQASLDVADYCFTSPAFNGSAQARTQVEALMCSAMSKTDITDVDAYLDELFEDAIFECEYFT